MPTDFAALLNCALFAAEDRGSRNICATKIPIAMSLTERCASQRVLKIPTIRCREKFQWRVLFSNHALENSPLRCARLERREERSRGRAVRRALAPRRRRPADAHAREPPAPRSPPVRRDARRVRADRRLQLPLGMGHRPGGRTRRGPRGMTGAGRRVAAFRALHASGCFVIPNPWDLGSARLLAGLGHRAGAVTDSAGAQRGERVGSESRCSRPIILPRLGCSGPGFNWLACLRIDTES